MVGGLRGSEDPSRGGWGGEWGSAVYYLSWRVGVSWSIWSQICNNLYFHMFLFREGSMTQINMASLMFLGFPCGSLCIMVKQSGLTGCPVVLLCWSEEMFTLINSNPLWCLSVDVSCNFYGHCGEWYMKVNNPSINKKHRQILSASHMGWGSV